jgi:hypothetical protein
MSLESLRPEPTFYPSPRIAMEAPAERLAYAALLSSDRSNPTRSRLSTSTESQTPSARRSSSSKCPTAATSFIILAGTPAHPRCRPSPGILSSNAAT